MRIESNPVGQSATPPSGRAAETQPVQAPAQGSGEEKTGDVDRVEISGLASRVAETLEDQAGPHAERIDALSADVQAGTYQLDSQALSHALIDQALSAGKP